MRVQVAGHGVAQLHIPPKHGPQLVGVPHETVCVEALSPLTIDLALGVPVPDRPGALPPALLGLWTSQPGPAHRASAPADVQHTVGVRPPLQLRVGPAELRECLFDQRRPDLAVAGDPGEGRRILVHGHVVVDSDPQELLAPRVVQPHVVLTLLAERRRPAEHRLHPCWILRRRGQCRQEPEVSVVAVADDAVRRHAPKKTGRVVHLRQPLPSIDLHG
mmetsp:Transcript_98045/g.245620  ORF Transcript_98045/g.245620 Transcript_98045/m.245620 type:complete len:218 (-) Transcript_98045:1302-1955(-)